MKRKYTLAARLLLGLLYFVFGLMFFFVTFPAPSFPPDAMSFLTGIGATGYFMPVLKATETICGLLLLAGVAAPVALVILAPITIQILLFHSILTPGIQNLPIPLVILVLHLLAAARYWPLYRPLFSRG